MHGLINRAVQTFVCNTYGPDRWRRASDAAGFGAADFEAMLAYDDALSLAMLDAVCAELGRSQCELLEDLGTHLVSHPQFEAVRRLLRFGGVTYVDFLNSLDDLPGRARLAVAELDLPQLELLEHMPGLYSLTCTPGLPGFDSVMMGLLRAMDDDYGALVMLDRRGCRDGCEVISIALVDTAFAEGRRFELGTAG